MCVIILAPKEAGDLPMENIDAGIVNNEDGWGFTAIQNGKFITEKGWGARGAKKVWRKYPGHFRIFHARLGNRGDINDANLHPFDASYYGDEKNPAEDRLLFHNGTIGIPRFFGDMCDSWHLALSLRPFPTTEHLLKSLDAYAVKETSKFVFLAGGKVYRMGNGWECKDGVWYSNRSAFPDMVRTTTGIVHYSSLTTGHSTNKSSGASKASCSYPTAASTPAIGSGIEIKNGKPVYSYGEDTYYSDKHTGYRPKSEAPERFHRAMYANDKKPMWISFDPSKSPIHWVKLGDVWFTKLDPRVKSFKDGADAMDNVIGTWVDHGIAPKDRLGIMFLLKNQDLVLFAIKKKILAGDGSPELASAHVHGFELLLSAVTTSMDEEEIAALSENMRKQVAAYQAEKLKLVNAAKVKAANTVQGDTHATASA